MNNKIMNIIKNAVEYTKLNNRFGMLSCMDYPNEYERMNELQNDISAEVTTVTAENDVSANGLTTVIYNVAADIVSGEIEADSTIVLYDQDDFIEYVCKAAGMMRKEVERFRDMLAWMQEKDRAGYMETRFILEWENDSKHKKQYYHDERFSFVIVVDTNKEVGNQDNG